MITSEPDETLPQWIRPFSSGTVGNTGHQQDGHNHRHKSSVLAVPLPSLRTADSVACQRLLGAQPGSINSVSIRIVTVCHMYSTCVSTSASVVLYSTGSPDTYRTSSLCRAYLERKKSLTKRGKLRTSLQSFICAGQPADGGRRR